VQLPSGYRLDWAGDFANFQAAIDRAVDRRAGGDRADPAAALCQLRQPADTLLAGSAIPMALIGGISA
jgi:cobalt-zinc-cadmium resistance protein CzcA